MLLEDITKITLGVVLKRKEAKYSSKNTYAYQVFNLKNYEENIEYDVFYSEENLENFVAQKGDLLFRLALPLKIIKVDDKIQGKLINNQYCIIKICNQYKQIYNIDFIKWFLESTHAKHQLEKIVIGTTIKTVPVAKLRQMRIPDLNSREQERISQIVNIWSKEKALYNKLINEKEKYYNSIIAKVINGGNKENE